MTASALLPAIDLRPRTWKLPTLFRPPLYPWPVPPVYGLPRPRPKIVRLADHPAGIRPHVEMSAWTGSDDAHLMTSPAGQPFHARPYPGCRYCYPPEPEETEAAGEQAALW